MIQRMILPAMLLMFLALSGNVIGETSIWVNLKSFSLVLGGTLITVLMAFPVKTARELIKSLQAFIHPSQENDENLLQEIVNLARIRRFKGLKELEDRGNSLKNSFLRKGIEMIVDGYNRQELQYILEKQYDIYFSHKESQANILLTAAKLAPAFGFVGTIVGLIAVLNNLADPSQIGGGMAVALLTTFYGLLQANFIFLPLSKKYNEHIKAEENLLGILIEGLLDIAENKNTHSISYRQKAFIEINDLPPKKSPERQSKTQQPLLKPFIQKWVKGK